MKMKEAYEEYERLKELFDALEQQKLSTADLDNIPYESERKNHGSNNEGSTNNSNVGHGI